MAIDFQPDAPTIDSQPDTPPPQPATPQPYQFTPPPAPEPPSITRTAVGTVERNIAPLGAAIVATKIAGPTTAAAGRAVGGFIGRRLAGAVAGAGIGALVPGLDLTGIPEVVGGLIGLFAPGFIAQMAASKAQTKIADVVAPKSELGTEEATAEEQAHPNVSTAVGLLTIGRPNPFKVVRAGRALASSEGRAALSDLLKASKTPEGLQAWRQATTPAIQKGVGDVIDTAHAGAINAAFNVAGQIQSGQYSAADLLKAAGEGTLLNEPWIKARHPATDQFDATKEIPTARFAQASPTLTADVLLSRPLGATSPGEIATIPENEYAKLHDARSSTGAKSFDLTSDATTWALKNPGASIPELERMRDEQKARDITGQEAYMAGKSEVFPLMRMQWFDDAIHALKQDDVGRQNIATVQRQSAPPSEPAKPTETKFTLTGFIESTQPIKRYADSTRPEEIVAGTAKPFIGTEVKLRTPNGKLESILVSGTLDNSVLGKHVSVKATTDIAGRLVANDISYTTPLAKTPTGQPKNIQEPIAAAIKPKSGEIVTGQTHDEIKARGVKGVEGFVLADNTFITRKEAKASFGRDRSHQFEFGKAVNAIYDQAVEAGYSNSLAFEKDFAKNADAEVLETKQEFLKRRYCSQTVPSNKSSAAYKDIKSEE